jgi:hypothetical protein
MRRSPMVLVALIPTPPTLTSAYNLVFNAKRNDHEL